MRRSSPEAPPSRARTLARRHARIALALVGAWIAARALLLTPGPAGSELLLAGALALALALAGWQVLGRPLEDAQEAIAALDRGEGEVRALLAAMPEPVVLLRREGTLALPPEGPAARHLAAFLAGPQGERARAAIREALGGARPPPLDLGPAAEGRRFSLRLARYRDEALGLLHDVTRERQLDRDMLDEVAKAQQQMGGELHDGLCQQLTGLLFLVQALEGAARRGESVGLADVARVREHLAACAVEARQLSHALYPVVLARRGLADALRRLADSTEALHRVRCTFAMDADAAEDLEGAAIHLYRIAQEAVANALRHGACQNLELALRRQDGALVLTIADDGRGVSADALARSEGIGLHSMNYRAEAIGAWLSISPRAGGGTRVCCTLPRSPAEGPS